MKMWESWKSILFQKEASLLHPLSPGTIALNRYRKKSLLPEEGLVAPLCGPARSRKPSQLLQGLSS